MDDIRLKIDLKPVSVNSSHKIGVGHTKRGNVRYFRTLTDSAKEFQAYFWACLMQQRGKVFPFASSYNPELKGISLEIYFYVNKERFFTKPKSKKNPRVTISLKSLDLDNCLKLTIDTLFKFMGIDDKNVTSIHARKIPTDGHDCMIIRISSASFPQLNEILSDDLKGQ